MTLATSSLSFQVEITLPDQDGLCETDELTIDPDDELFKDPPEVTLNQSVKDDGQFITIADDELIHSTLLDNSICGPIEKEFWDISTGQELALNPNIFTRIDLSS